MKVMKDLRFVRHLYLRIILVNDEKKVKKNKLLLKFQLTLLFGQGGKMTKLPPCKNSQNFKGKLKEKLKMMAKMRKQLEKEAGTWKK